MASRPNYILLIYGWRYSSFPSDEDSIEGRRIQYCEVCFTEAVEILC